MSKFSSYKSIIDEPLFHVPGTLKTFVAIGNGYWCLNHTEIWRYHGAFKWHLNGDKKTKKCIYSQIA